MCIVQISLNVEIVSTTTLLQKNVNQDVWVHIQQLKSENVGINLMFEDVADSDMMLSEHEETICEQHMGTEDHRMKM